MHRAGPFRLHGNESRVRRFRHHRTDLYELNVAMQHGERQFTPSSSDASGQVMKKEKTKQKIPAAPIAGAGPAAVGTAQ
jgi:hypothetical protein